MVLRSAVYRADIHFFFHRPRDSDESALRKEFNGFRKRTLLFRQFVFGFRDTDSTGSKEAGRAF